MSTHSVQLVASMCRHSTKSAQLNHLSLCLWICSTLVILPVTMTYCQINIETPRSVLHPDLVAKNTEQTLIPIEILGKHWVQHWLASLAPASFQGKCIRQSVQGNVPGSFCSCKVFLQVQDFEFIIWGKKKDNNSHTITIYRFVLMHLLHIVENPIFLAFCYRLNSSVGFLFELASFKLCWWLLFIWQMSNQNRNISFTPKKNAKSAYSSQEMALHMNIPYIIIIRCISHGFYIKNVHFFCQLFIFFLYQHYNYFSFFSNFIFTNYFEQI